MGVEPEGATQHEQGHLPGAPIESRILIAVHAMAGASASGAQTPPLDRAIPAGTTDMASSMLRRWSCPHHGRVAEARGFEPLVTCATAVFKTAAFGHSATPPREGGV